ncbi:MAG: NADP-dependent phosphogluconate dehydrogenase [Syntrophales bacterium]|nr:NADP-dependent phosphogluconate dehydrogenase [Syntrophales bacterium]
MDDQKFNIGMIGLGVMGRNLLLNMTDNGYSVVGYDQDLTRLDVLKGESQGRNIGSARSLKEFLPRLKSPHIIIFLVPAGPTVDKVIHSLFSHLKENDILIDCGNSHFTDTNLRQKALAAKGISLLGVGISGGEQGARHGPSIMAGGSRKAYEACGTLFDDIAARVGEHSCAAYLGPGSAGHFVKMIHNGIEYGLMELIAETYDLMKRGMGLSDDELADVYRGWNEDLFHAYLIDITAKIFKHVDEKTGKRLIDVILDEARQKGTGKWTSQTAMDLRVPAPVIDASVSVRDLSDYKTERERASRIIFASHSTFKGQREVFIDTLQKALYLAFIITYAQGMSIIREASDEYGYKINLADVARIWRGGCIIRSSMLDGIMTGYSHDPGLPNILVDPSIARQAAERQHDLRAVVCSAANLGIPAPAMMAALAYFDGFRSPWMPMNLVQAQRDYFGAHMYERVDEKGIFHTKWEEEPG